MVYIVQWHYLQQRVGAPVPKKKMKTHIIPAYNMKILIIRTVTTIYP